MLVRATLYAKIHVDDDLIAQHLEQSSAEEDPFDCAPQTEEEAARALAFEEMQAGNMDISDWEFSTK